MSQYNSNATIDLVVKAVGCTDHKNGLVTLHLASHTILSPEEHKILGKLYPNLLNQALDLLDKEVLLNCFATEADKNEAAARLVADSIPKKKF